MIVFYSGQGGNGGGPNDANPECVLVGQANVMSSYPYSRGRGGRAGARFRRIVRGKRRRGQQGGGLTEADLNLLRALEAGGQLDPDLRDLLARVQEQSQRGEEE